MLEYFENKFTAELLKVPSHTDPNMSDLVQREHSLNYGKIGVGSLRSTKNLQYLRNGTL